MAATESSVVVALKEVRRLELERQRREEEARRSALEDERIRSEARVSVQYGPGMQPFGQLGTGGWGDGGGAPESFARPVHRTSEVLPVPGYGQDYAGPQGFLPGQTAPAWEGFPAPAKKSSTFKAVLITVLLCGGAAAGGLWKLRSDHAKALSQLETQRQRTEEARNEAVQARAKAEQELKVKLAELEAKVSTASAKANAAASALAAARNNAATTTSEPPLSPAAAKAARKAAKASAAAAKAASVAPLAPPVPKAPPALPPLNPAAKVAKKKSLSDDPLGGLKL
jgi:hypothetical protein